MTYRNDTERRLAYDASRNARDVYHEALTAYAAAANAHSDACSAHAPSDEIIATGKASDAAEAAFDIASEVYAATPDARMSE
tara:strand:+ start:264 stop:509 length:246 start_codon:yes stop_codon:yes gene_type:complete